MPDYADVTIPCNIAPLCFSVEGMEESALIVKGSTDSICMTSTDGSFNIPENEWHALLGKEAGKSLKMTVCRKYEGGWQALKPVDIHVSTDSIDPYVVYRRIQPGYGLWDKMGIYQRNLESYDEEPIYENREGKGNCINCHAFNQGNPRQWQVHVRRNYKGSYIINAKDGGDADVRKLPVGSDVKPVYPSWHPSGRYIAYSSNKTFFHIHTRDKNRWEVMDDGSDVMVVDVETGEVVKTPLIAAEDRYETYPCFSPDGKWLYFSSAAAADTITSQYDKVQYSICRIAFDTANASFGEKVDTIVRAISPTEGRKSASYYFPRLSPDGRWLCCTTSAYGNFGVCHRDARLCLTPIVAEGEGEENDRKTIPLNLGEGRRETSGGVSWHSWSSNSRWLVFSSKQDDGIYTRLYFTHIDEKGRCTKAFVLPQLSARDYYDMMMDGYNIPELVRGHVTGSPASMFE